MLKDVLTNRLVLGGLACLVLLIVGCTLYLKHVENAREFARTAEIVKRYNEQNSETASSPEGIKFAQGGHFHEDGTWHPEPHPPAATPEAAQVLEHQRPVSKTHETHPHDLISESEHQRLHAALREKKAEKQAKIEKDREMVETLSPFVNG